MPEFEVAFQAVDGMSGGGLAVEADSPAEAMEKVLAMSDMSDPIVITSVALVRASEEENIEQPGVTTIHRRAIFGDADPSPDAVHLAIDLDRFPVHYFVGRNGSGKSRTARAVVDTLGEGARLLSTDRLIGIMGIESYSFGALPGRAKGAPLDQDERNQMLYSPEWSVMATPELYALRDDPVVALRVAAFVQRTLRRRIEMRETAGYIDPFVVTDSGEHSLLRDEGHGLRELVVLLAAIYREDWRVLIVDEPELHLHPSMSRLWLGELNRVCTRTGRHAVVVSHEPSFIRPKSADDLGAIWLFSPGNSPRNVLDAVSDPQRDRVAATLTRNPQLVSDLVYSPRPVLVEGITDLAAFTVALGRLASPEVAAQTDFIDAGGRGGVALWLEISTRLGLDARAVLDLDVLFQKDVQRTVDSLPGFRDALLEMSAGSASRLSTIVRNWITEADSEDVGAASSDRAAWLAGQNDPKSAAGIRKARLLALLASHGVWVHAEGALEDVLGIAKKDEVSARAAAEHPCGLDTAAQWAAYDPDPTGDLGLLLGVEALRVAHRILEAERLQPERLFGAPVGESGERDSKLFSVSSTSSGHYRLDVVAPQEFAGRGFDFTKESASSDLVLEGESDEVPD